MNPGNVILARIQQADGALKSRPVLVLNHMPPFDDLLVCAISSKLHHEVKGFDEIIGVDEQDFKQSGLKVSSLIRLGLLATIPSNAAIGKIGEIAWSRLEGLRHRLSQYILHS